jgi:hypothetical protein
MEERQSNSINTEEKGGETYNEYETVKRTTLIPLGIFICIVLVWAIIKICQLYVPPAENTKAAIDGLLGLLTLIVIAVQTGIIKMQWDAMQDSLQEFRNSREMENRAWIGIKSLEPAYYPDGVGLVALVVNAGNSPANVTLRVKGEYRESSPPDDVQYGSMQDKGSVLTLFGHSEVPKQIAFLEGVPGLPVSRDYPTRIWYFYGDLDYIDIFGKPHKTRFCYFVRKGRDLGEGKVNASLAVAEGHNSFD